ncbi:MAG: ABC transporter substrate-binding protein [Clostridia bacterium]|nr:ABC transporter substrate-binding protein [Clostridia bacterium]
MKKKLSVLALLLAMVMILSSCGPSTSNPSPGTDGTQSSAQPSVSSKANPDELVVAISTEPSSLDPHNVNMVTAQMIGAHIYDNLVGITKDNKIVPELATEWEWLDDTTLRMKLREDVDFTNGAHFTADDVVYNIQRACENSATAAAFSSFDGAGTVKVDDYTVDIKMKSAYPNALTVLAGGRALIVCKSAIEEMGDEAYGRAPVGSGKFSVVSWASGDSIRLTRNDNYWGDEPAYKDLTFRIITENASRTIELETGEVDISFDVDANDVARLEGSPDITVLNDSSSTMNHIVINTVNFDTLRNDKVREAMHMALNMDAIVQTAFKGYGTVASSLAPDNCFGFKAVGPTPYDPEGAKALIAESGFDTSTEITLQIYQNQQIQSMAEMIANMWTAVGLNVNVEILDRATLVTNNASGQTPMCITTVTASDGNIESVFLQWEKPSAAFTDDQELVAKIKAIKGIVDDDERAAAYAELQQETWDLNIVIPIATSNKIFGIRNYVQGFEFNADNRPDLSVVTFS